MLSVLLDHLHQQARASGHRRCLVLSGDPRWIRQQLGQVAQRGHWCWIGDDAVDGVAQVTPMRQAAGLLGQDNSLVVFNAYSGFHPDAFGAISGTLCGGGVLLLLAPPLASWPGYADPDGLRYVAEPAQLPQMGQRFITRLVALFDADPAVILAEQHRPWPALTAAVETVLPVETVADADCATSDQRDAVAAVIKTVTGHRRRPLVLSADRGRGKSSALGIAAARLMIDKPRQILVTAPSPKAVMAVFAHAGRVLAATGEPGCRQGHELQWRNSRLAFVAPDELLRAVPVFDLLLVDEAAAIPTPLLTRMLSQYARVVYATTLHGYEGTGRGFALRFQQILARQCPQWRRLHLNRAIRWRDGDPLEALVFNCLGLDARAVEVTAADAIRAADCRYQRLSQDELLARPDWLEQLFGLLVLAHYQTTPSDFRQLLDAPGLVIFAGFHQDRIVATALVAREGGLSSTLNQAIWAGNRRLRGHLLPQSLMAQAGYIEAGALHFGRIMRIAVHPVLHRAGVGRGLHQVIRHWGQDHGLDAIGASFGATAELLGYWRAMACRLVRLGITRDTASGCHSALVLEPLTADARRLTATVEARFARQLPGMLSRQLKLLEPEMVLALLDAVQADPVLTAEDQRDAAAFGWGRRPLELVLPALQALVWHQRHQLARVSDTGRLLLITLILQEQDWAVAGRTAGLTGRKAAEAGLREAVAQLAPFLKTTFGAPLDA